MAAGWLPLYLVEEDVPLLQTRLNADPEIAFIVRDGPERWRAAPTVDDIRGKSMLWHIPGGPLPLLHVGGGDTSIVDPFAGWKEERSGLDRSVPYFGPYSPSSLLMRVWVPDRSGPENLIFISDFSWPALGAMRSPPASTRQWWNRLRKWVSQHARRITRRGPLEGPRADIWAMPAALRAIEAGQERADNPWRA
jgi:hypothetical protein